MLNTLYYGDNLEVLREHIADASVAVAPFAEIAATSRLLAADQRQS